MVESLPSCPLFCCAASPQVQLECFQKGFDKIHSSHDELVSRGGAISKEIDQLDSSMFGPSDSTHPAVQSVKEHVAKLEASVRKMDSTAAPHLQQLKDCLQFHLLQERAGKVGISHSVTLLSMFKDMEYICDSSV